MAAYTYKRQVFSSHRSAKCLYASMQKSLTESVTDSANLNQHMCTTLQGVAYHSVPSVDVLLALCACEY